MVCDRCIKVMQVELEKLGYPIKSIELGKVEFEKSIEINETELTTVLEKEGFELIDDESKKVINKIKTLIIQQIRNDSEKSMEFNLSTVLEKEIGKNYTTLSTLFSKIEGRTIEKFTIQQRIERVKELLVYGEKTVSEIAWELGYSSAQYLSNQFKSETGLSPTQFRALIGNMRTPIDKV